MKGSQRYCCLLFLLILLMLLLLLLCQGPLKVDGGATKCPIMGIHPVALTNEFQMPFKRQLAICPFRFNLIKQPVATTTTFHHVLKTALSHWWIARERARVRAVADSPKWKAKSMEKPNWQAAVLSIPQYPLKLWSTCKNNSIPIPADCIRHFGVLHLRRNGDPTTPA